MNDPLDMTCVTLAVLAGGEGQRMGVPKAQLRIGNRPILDYLITRIAWPGPTLLVTAPGREHPPGAHHFDSEAIDPVAGQGPLRGVLTALQDAKTDRVVVTTVDMPFMGLEQLMWVENRLMQSTALGLMLQTMVDGRASIEPFPFACSTRAAEIMRSRLSSQRRSMHSLAALKEFVVEPAPLLWLAEVWTNLNSPDDFATFLRQASL